MSTGAFPPPAPMDDDEAQGAVTRQDGNDDVLDDDANDDLVDSAEADRLAAEGDKTD